MALSRADVDNIDSAIASAELTVTIDGKSVTYRSILELKQAREHIVAQLAEAAGTRRSVYYFTAGGKRD